MRFTFIICALLVVNVVDCDVNLETKIEAEEIQHVLDVIKEVDQHGNAVYTMEKGLRIEGTGEKVALVGRFIEIIGEVIGQYIIEIDRLRITVTPPSGTTYSWWSRTWKRIRRGVGKAGEKIGKALLAKKVGQIVAGAALYRIEKFEELNPIPSKETIVNFAKSLQVLGVQLQNVGKVMGNLSPEVMQRIHNSTVVKIYTQQFLLEVIREYSTTLKNAQSKTY